MRTAIGTTPITNYQQRTHLRSLSTKKPMRMNSVASKHRHSRALLLSRVVCDSAVTSRNKNCASIESLQRSYRDQLNLEWVSTLTISESQDLMIESAMTRAQLYASHMGQLLNHYRRRNSSRRSPNTMSARMITLAGLNRR